MSKEVETYQGGPEQPSMDIESRLSPRSLGLVRYLIGSASPSDQVVAGRNYEAGSSNVRARWDIYSDAEQYLDIESTVYESLALNGDETIVDLGAADGATLCRFRQEFSHAGVLIGVEPYDRQYLTSPFWDSTTQISDRGQLFIAKPELVAPPLSPAEAYFIKGTAETTGLASQSADVITAFFSMYHVADRKQAYTEIKRVLRPGGLFVATTSNSINKAGHRILEEAIAAELNIKPPEVMNKDFVSESAVIELKKEFKYVSWLEYEDKLVINSFEKFDRYRASLLSMRDQFDPIPDQDVLEESVANQLLTVLARMDSDAPFTEDISRSIFLCSDTPIGSRKGFSAVRNPMWH